MQRVGAALNSPTVDNGDAPPDNLIPPLLLGGLALTVIGFAAMTYLWRSTSKLRRRK